MSAIGRAVAVLGLLAAFSVLVACGGSGDSDNADGERPSTSAQTATAPDLTAFKIGTATCTRIGNVLSIVAPVANSGPTPLRVFLSEAAKVRDGEVYDRFGRGLAVVVGPGESVDAHGSMSLVDGQTLASPNACQLDPAGIPTESVLPLTKDDLEGEMRDSVNTSFCSEERGQCAGEVVCTEPTSAAATCEVELVGPGVAKGEERVSIDVTIAADGSWTP